MTSGNPPCPFCAIAAQSTSTPSALSIRDQYPVTRGHTLIVPRRHVETYFDTTDSERAEIWRLVDETKRQLDAEHHPDGYNVGFNAGAAAGQTVMHLHVHVIPRYRGDVDDPRGGIRGVIPDKQKYAALDDPFAGLPAFVPGEEVHFQNVLRRALARAERADLLAAFLQTSGMEVLQDDLVDAARRGAVIRVIAGDYLGITSADALRRLLSLSEANERIQPHLYEIEGNTPFHPKSYMFVQGQHGVAYVGSSNLSRGALTDSVEWNLRLVSSQDATAFAEVTARFERLLASPRTKPLTRELIDAYQRRAPVPEAPRPEPRAIGHQPHVIQVEALAALNDSRRDGDKKGLVVLATGLGKTLLAAFDFRAMGGMRALFLAHREEILDQASAAWQSVFPDKVAGTYGKGKHEREADLLFASVQTLSRDAHLTSFPPDHFDYIVVDEFHHAAASTYRKVIAHFNPRFLVGLTATPNRADGRPLADLCGDNAIYECGLVRGIAQRLLVPFRYFGVKDEIDFAPIPWRSGRFDVEELTNAVATTRRAEQTLREWRKRAPQARRTLAFCASTRHADYMAEYLRAQGVRAVAVHAGPSSAPRASSLRDLKAGDLDVICAVDVFNEGLDVPDIDTVLMLRPTESPIVFLQQLGRGLRRADGKQHVTVVDFIGNHRSFLQRPQGLAYLTGEAMPPLVALERIRQKTLALPEGCHVEIETEVVEMLESLARVGSDDVAIYEYMTFRDAHGRRPTAAELFAEGVQMRSIAERHGSWFRFVEKQGDLTEDEARALSMHEPWLRDVQLTKMNKSYKMLALQALIDRDELFVGARVEDNARRAFETVRDDVLLFKEMREDAGRQTYDGDFVRKWRELPLLVWTKSDSMSRKWFRLEGDRFIPAYDVHEVDRPAFEQMSEELIELRLREHVDRLRRDAPLAADQAPILMKVSHSGGNPILRFDRTRRGDVPEGDVEVAIDEARYILGFRKIAVNTAFEGGSTVNVLPNVLRRMFGLKAGLPGSRMQARLLRDGDLWRLEADADDHAQAAASNVIPLPRVPFFSDLRVACGLATASGDGAGEARDVSIASSLPSLDPKRHFVVRASGDSMDGGTAPIRDGDLVLCEWAAPTTPDAIDGKPYLVVGHDGPDSSFALLKVPRKVGDHWVLESWNPAFPTQEVPPGGHLKPVARVVEVVEEVGGLTLYGEYDRASIAKAFGSKLDPSWQVGHRDLEVHDAPQTILMVTLRKEKQTKLEHRYADHFPSPTQFDWESQASTKLDSAKGRRITGHAAEGRTIHLFARYDGSKPFIYVGALDYVRHEGEAPMSVTFAMHRPLPAKLFDLWKA